MNHNPRSYTISRITVYRVLNGEIINEKKAETLKSLFPDKSVVGLKRLEYMMTDMDKVSNYHMYVHNDSSIELYKLTDEKPKYPLAGDYYTQMDFKWLFSLSFPQDVEQNPQESVLQRSSSPSVYPG